MTEASIALALGGAAAAILAQSASRTALGAWISGVGVGGLFLSLGSEYLALAQWLAATVVAFLVVFAAPMLGDVEKRAESRAALWIGRIAALTIGSGFAALIWLGRGGRESELPTVGGVGELRSLGQTLLGGHLFSLLTMGTVFLCVVLGACLLARPGAAK